MKERDLQRKLKRESKMSRDEIGTETEKWDRRQLNMNEMSREEEGGWRQKECV